MEPRFGGTLVVTAPANFDDDPDTVSGCTGACCDPVTLPLAQYRAVSRDPRNGRNARYIMNMLTPRGPLPREGMVEFDCRYFDRETRLCTAYERRPKMCRDFPEKGLCALCGSRFDTPTRSAESAPRGAMEHDTARLAVLRALMSETPERSADPPRRHEKP